MKKVLFLIFVCFTTSTFKSQIWKDWSLLHHGILELPDSLRYFSPGTQIKYEMRGQTRFLIKGDTAISKVVGNGRRKWYLLLHSLSTHKLLACFNLPEDVYYWKLEKDKLFYINGYTPDGVAREYEVYEFNFQTLQTTKIVDTYALFNNKHKLPIVSPNHVEYLPAQNYLIINKRLDQQSCIINLNTKKIKEFGETGELLYNTDYAPGKLIVKPWIKWKQENWGKLEYREINFDSYKMSDVIVDEPNKYKTKESTNKANALRTLEGTAMGNNDRIYFADAEHNVIHTWELNNKWDGVETAYDFPIKLRYPLKKYQEVIEKTGGSLLSILNMKQYGKYCTKEMVMATLRYWNEHSKLKLWFNEKEWRFDYYNDLHLNNRVYSLIKDKIYFDKDVSKSNRAAMASEHIKKTEAGLKWETIDQPLEISGNNASGKNFFIAGDNYVFGSLKGLSILNTKTAKLNNFMLPIYAHDFALLDSVYLLIGNPHEIYKVNLVTMKLVGKLTVSNNSEWPEHNKLFLSSSGKHIIIHNEMASLTGLYDSKTLKPIAKLPVTENIERLFVSDNGENIYFCHPLSSSPEIIASGYEFTKYNLGSGKEQRIYISGIILSADLKNQLFAARDVGEPHKADFNLVDGNTMTINTVSANNPRQMLSANTDGYYMGVNCRIFNFDKKEYFMLKPEYETSVSCVIKNSPYFLVSNSSNEFYKVELKENKLVAKTKFASNKEVVNFTDGNGPVFSLQTIKEYRQALENEKQKLIALEEAAKKAEELALQERIKELGELCSNCKGKGYDESRKCTVSACDRGYVYGDKTEAVYQNGAILYKRTQSQIPCRLCKGRDIWVCDVCNGSGGKEK